MREKGGGWAPILGPRDAAKLEFTEGPLDREEERQETKARLPRMRSRCLGEKHSEVESRPQEVDAECGRHGLFTWRRRQRPNSGVQPALPGRPLHMFSQ